MAPRRVRVNKFDYKKLTANDVICPICRSILIKPVVLPCSHGFCASCFETTTKNANLVCPLCKVRVGSWLRTATKSKKLINETFWQAIQDLFPVQVKYKLHKRDVNIDDKTNTKKVELDGKLIPDIKKGAMLGVDKFKSYKKSDKSNEQCIKSVPSTSTFMLAKTSGLVNAVSKNNNQAIPISSVKSGKPTHVSLNNFASKEYTCRILCQNLNSKESQKYTPSESLILIQKKNKRIQKITESEALNDRSNSIESECLYFKPIDYRHNPPSEGLAPIKVPTRKPNVNANVKILAPCGQNQISMNYLESAFARLFSPALSEEKGDTSKQKSSVVQESSHDSVGISNKRKHEKLEIKSRKKIKSNHKPNETQSYIDSDEKNAGDELPKICDNRGPYGVENINFSVNKPTNIKKPENIKRLSNKLFSEEDIKRSLQEKADFELATKLQQTYNQTTKYSTRSAVLKRMAATKQINIMTPFEVN